MQKKNVIYRTDGQTHEQLKTIVRNLTKEKNGDIIGSTKNRADWKNKVKLKFNKNKNKNKTK